MYGCLLVLFNIWNSLGCVSMCISPCLKLDECDHGANLGRLEFWKMISLDVIDNSVNVSDFGHLLFLFKTNEIV